MSERNDTARVPRDAAASRSAAPPDAPSPGQRPCSGTLEASIRALRSLPVLPATADAIAVRMAKADRSAAEQLAIARRDPALAAILLRHANAAEGKSPRGIDSIEQACAVLGPRQTAAIMREVLQAGPARGLPDIDPDDFQERALVAAQAARHFAQVSGVEHGDGLCTAALLHGVGRLALREAAPERWATLPRGLSVRAQLAAEEEAFGADHAECSAVLAQAWNWPPVLVECLRFQHRAEESPQQPRSVAVVALAVLAAEVFCRPNPEDVETFAAACGRLCAMLHLLPDRFNAALAATKAAIKAERANAEFQRLADRVLSSPASAAASEAGTPEPSAAQPGAAPGEARASGAVEAPTQYTRTRRRDADARQAGPFGRLTTGRAVLAASLAAAAAAVYFTVQSTTYLGSPPPAPHSVRPVAPEAKPAGAVPVRRFDRPRDSETQELLEQLRKDIEENPAGEDTPANLLQLGNLYYTHAKDYEPAATYYLRLLTEYPGAPGAADAYLNLADCYERLGQPNEQMQVYERMLQAFPEGSAEHEIAREKLNP